MKKEEEILESVNCKTTMNYDDNNDQEVYYRHKDVLIAINKALNIPVVVEQSEQLCQYKTCNKKNYMYGYCKHHLAQQDL